MKKRTKKINSGLSKVALSALMVILSLGLMDVRVLHAEQVKFKKQDTGLYKDVFDDNMFYDLTSLLRFDRLFSKITGKKSRSKNVNIYDEVPNNALFTNRHGRNRLSLSELEDGPKETDGPDVSSSIKVIKGKVEGLNPGFFVEDSRGDKYLIKFDYIDSFELRTSAEVIASRFYHALGYNVPQYTIALIAPGTLVAAEGAKTYDDTGFLKDLTNEKLEEYMLFLPQDSQGNYRVSASKLVSGAQIGYFTFHGKRDDNPDDKLLHRNRREVRALQVFSSWLNNYDVRDSNTLEMVQTVNGEQQVKHYLIDFGSSLGGGSAVPMFAREHMMDYGEATKAFAALGLWEKPWQKRWREMGGQVDQSPAVGDFDNNGFRPEKFKTQLPYYAFKDLTRADAFWAAKNIMSFTDEEIHSVVKAGRYSDPKDANYVAQVLIERRDIIGRYWFSQSSALDRFDINLNSLVFEDLSVQYGFEQASDSSYRVKVYSNHNGKRRKLSSFETKETSIDLSSWMQNHPNLDIKIQTVRGSGKPNPKVCVKVRSGKIAGIHHKD